MLKSIQFLRAIAAYGVVLFHTSRFLRGNQTTVDVPDIVVGAAGVDLFFVISGFVMVYVAKPHDTPGQFMLRRFIRIAPLYWLATLGVIVTISIVPWVFQNVDLSWMSVFLSLSFLPSHNGAGLLEPILFLGWTLNFEILFYAIFAGSLMLPASYRLIGLTAAISAVWLAASLIGIGAASEFYSNAILFEFVFGCWIAAALMSENIRKRCSPMFGLFLVMAGLIGFAMSPIDMDVTLQSDRILRYGIPAALVVAGLVMAEMTAKSPLRLPLQSLGNSSYSAYLLHAFIVPIAGALCLRVLPQSWLAVLIVPVVVFGLTMVAATISYRLIELRLSKALRTVLIPTRERKERSG